MSRTIRFHLDENCPRALADGLRRRGIDVTTTPEAGLLEATDEEQTAYALREGRVIFTQDEDFLAIQASGTPHAGIAYCKKDTRGIGDMIRGLALIWEVYEPAEMVGGRKWCRGAENGVVSYSRLKRHHFLLRAATADDDRGRRRRDLLLRRPPRLEIQ